MREIKFKAKRVSDGEWVEGSYIRLVVYGVMKHFIIPANGLTFDDILIEIDPNTLCQFTGLIDKNGKEIYEGDILSDGKGDNGAVRWIEALGGFCAYVDNTLYSLNEGDPNRSTQLEYTEVIGNIHNI